MPTKFIKLVLFAAFGINVLMDVGYAQTTENGTIPKTWDNEAVAALELPLANAAFSPVHVTSDYYYRMIARPIYKSYPIYAPDKEPPGYQDWLKLREPEIVFDAAKIRREAD